MQPGRSESELEDFLCSLKGRDKVRVVCIDLSSTYRRLVKKWFPNARIVADRFHVVRLIYHHCLQLARALAPELKNTEAHRPRCAKHLNDSKTNNDNAEISYSRTIRNLNNSTSKCINYENS